MKFKSIFIVFNIVIAFSFLFFFFMPIFILGIDHFLNFVSSYWIAFVLFFVLIVVFNTYFIINWKFFKLLENEDWYGLITFLENKIFNKNSFSKRAIRILLNTYLCTSNTDGIKKLGLFFKTRKPVLLSEFALQFSIPYLLTDNPEESETFFRKLLEDKNLKNRDWIQWDYGLILMQQKKHEQAITTFSALLFPQVDSIIYLLALYMLNSLSTNNNRLKDTIEKAKNEYAEKYALQTLIEKLEKNKNNIQLLSLKASIQEAFKWMYPDGIKNEKAKVDASKIQKDELDPKYWTGT